MEDHLRVLVVDDSRAFRQALCLALAKDPSIEIVGEAADGNEAYVLAERLRPDVISMDVIMPHCSGVEAAEPILRRRHVPIVLLTNMMRHDEQWMALNALRIGVLEVVNKPILVGPKAVIELQTMIRLLRNAASAVPAAEHEALSPLPGIMRPSRSGVIAVGASTGGPSALEKVLAHLHDKSPPTVVAQHLAPGLAESFAKWLGRALQRETICVARTEVLRPGVVYLAKGGLNMELWRNSVIVAPAAEGAVAPNIDIMFRSVASLYGRNSVGIILTGMGSDGVSGMLEMRARGAWTLAQEREGCVVYGMPMVAHQRGACQEVLSLERLAAVLAPVQYAALGGRP